MPIFDRKAEDLIGRSVAAETVNAVGDVDFIGMRRQTLVAIIGVGGFLGRGENKVVVQIEKLILRDDELIPPEFTRT